MLLTDLPCEMIDAIMDQLGHSDVKALLSAFPQYQWLYPAWKRRHRKRMYTVNSDGVYSWRWGYPE